MALIFCSIDQGQIQHSATCPASTTMSCGAVPAEKHGAFLENLHHLLHEAEQRKHSAAKGQPGRCPKTPASLLALVCKALKVTMQDDGDADSQNGGVVSTEMELVQPRGGFTDVGLHTGGAPRDTAWPLVREAIKACH